MRSSGDTENAEGWSGESSATEMSSLLTGKLMECGLEMLENGAIDKDHEMDDELMWKQSKRKWNVKKCPVMEDGT